MALNYFKSSKKGIKYWVLPSTLVVVLVSFLSFQQKDTYKRDPIESILNLFDTHSVVMLGESHGRKEYHEFVLELLSHKKTAKIIDDIVVEFGNAAYQNQIDKYLSGEDMEEDSLSLIWRNTTQLFVWDSPVYENFYKEIKKINAANKRSSQYRVILGDPPIQWAKVNNAKDYETYLSQRDVKPFSLIEKEVIKKSRKALVIIGGMHILPLDLRTSKPTKDQQRASLGQLLEEKYPDEVVMIWNVVPDAEGAVQFRDKKIPFYQQVNDTPFSENSFQRYYSGSINVQVIIDGQKQWRPLSIEQFPSTGQLVDGLLYLSNDDTTVEADASIYTKDYLNTLERRAAIMDEYFGWQGYQNQVNRLKGLLDRD